MVIVLLSVQHTKCDRRWILESHSVGLAGSFVCFVSRDADGGVEFVVLSSCHTEQRAVSGTLVLFALVEHAALNPPVVLFLPGQH